MWCPEGYLVFEEVSALIWQQIVAANPIESGESVLATMKAWQSARVQALGQFAASCPSLSLASPVGQIVSISPKILTFAEPPGKYEVFAFLDSKTWLVSTGRLAKRAAVARERLQEIRRTLKEAAHQKEEFEAEIRDLLHRCQNDRYLPAFKNFEGWALTCKAADAPPKTLNRSNQTNSPSNNIVKDEPTTAELTAHIIELFDADQLVSKQHLRELFCPQLKIAAFNAAWKDAATRRPELSTPGPKVRKRPKSE